MADDQDLRRDRYGAVQRSDKRNSSTIGERLREVFGLEPSTKMPGDFTALLKKLDH
jgi:hypothetical protein